MFKEKVKIWHDKKIKKKEFKVGDQVLLYNSRFKVFCRKKLHWNVGNIEFTNIGRNNKRGSSSFSNSKSIKGNFCIGKFIGIM